MPRSHPGTLVPNTVTPVTITDSNPGGIEVVNRTGTGEIWVRLDGVDPTVAGDDCFLILGARRFPNPHPNTAVYEQVTVKLISTAALNFTIEGNPIWAVV